MNVYGLFASLGFDIDAASFAAADAALDKVRMSAEALQTTMRENASHFSQVVLDTSRAARGDVEDAVVSWDGWQKKTREAIDWTAHWARGVKAAVGVAVAAFAGQQIVSKVAQYGDAFNGAASRIRGMSADTAEATRVQEQLFQSAQDTGSSFGSVAGLYQQIGKSAKDLGMSTEQAVQYTDTLNKAIKASGAAGGGADAALQQLSQGLGSGVLRGEEFNSVLEQAPIIIDLIAKSMGKTRGEMRKLAEGGKLTSAVVFKALNDSKADVDEAFAKRIPAVSDMFVRLRNEIERAFGEMLQDKSTLAAFEKAIKAVSVVVLTLVKGFAALVKFMANNERLVVGALIAIASALTVVAGAAAAAWLAIYGPVAVAVAALATFYAYSQDIVVGLAASMLAIGDAIMWVGGQFKKLGRALASGARAAVQAFQDVGNAIVGAFRYVFDWIEDKIEWVASKMQDIVPDWMRDAYNFATGNDGGTVSDLTGPAPGPMLRPTKGSPGAMQMSVGDTTINVNAGSVSDPQALAGMVAQQADAAWDRRMRSAYAASGGAE